MKHFCELFSVWFVQVHDPESDIDALCDGPFFATIAVSSLCLCSSSLTMWIGISILLSFALFITRAGGLFYCFAQHT